MNRTETLEAALHAVTDRGATYGKPEDVFGMIAALWTAYLGGRLDVPLSGFDVSQLMILLKVARAKNNPQHTDNQVDIAGYAGCANELAEKLRTAPVEPAAPSTETLPTVPDFIRSGRLRLGDTTIDSNGLRSSVIGITTDDPHESFPIETYETQYSVHGYNVWSRDFDRDGLHLICIKRNGVTVAEGQVYDEQ